MTSENSPVYKSAKRFVESTEKTNAVVNGNLDPTKKPKATFKVLDVGGQEVCFLTHAITNINLY